jgi:hypothetical protein
MTWFFIVLALISANAIFGAAVWVAIDNADQHLFKWYESADRLGFIGPFVQFATLQAWPVGLWLWMRNRRRWCDG